MELVKYRLSPYKSHEKPHGNATDPGDPRMFGPLWDQPGTPRYPFSADD